MHVIHNCQKKFSTSNQHAWERPDIVNRVYKMKLNELIKDIMHEFVLGKTIVYVYVVEFQYIQT